MQQDHEWVSTTGRPWSLRVRSDLCGRCGITPDAHPSRLELEARRRLPEIRERWQQGPIHSECDTCETKREHAYRDIRFLLSLL